jgi:ADP-heptose:LPS heptosyltransferase
MNILVIKQTSLGDVLHASGHIRAIKAFYPDSSLTVMTATTSAELFRHNPWVEKLILVDRYGFKKNWWRKPLWSVREMWTALMNVREKEYDLAIDLQGLAKTVVFLYGARAQKKFAKGHWWGVDGYRDRNEHAIREMDGLLQKAGVSIQDTSMELVPGDDARLSVDRLLGKINPDCRPILLMSPYSRWNSKDWPLQNYLKLAWEVADDYLPVLTGTSDRKGEIAGALAGSPDNPVINLAGELTLLEFAELVGRARLMLTGDSFPMHVAGAMKIPVIALFGPTDENKVGPLGDQDHVLRVSDCDKCDRANCKKQCLARLENRVVIEAVRDIPRPV